MSVELRKVMVGLEPEVYEALNAIAVIKHDGEMGAAGRDIITRCVMGEAHALKVLAARFARATRQGNSG